MSDATQPSDSKNQNEDGNTIVDSCDNKDELGKPKWQLLTREQRRVLGVLAEKAKTTPDSYPLTLNAITTGSNQKSNRFPQMELQPARVEDVLEELKAMEAVTEIHGSGRVPKFRHNLYEWLGVDKVELAVMAELLLRGQQSIGELRGRAARMEPIGSVNELKPILAGLVSRKLVIELTDSGRGQMVTHGLYYENEIKKVRDSVGSSQETAERTVGTSPTRQESTDHSEVGSLRDEVNQLRVDMKSVIERLNELERQLG